VLNHVGYEHPWLTDGRHEGWFHPRCEMVFSVQQSVERCWLAGLPDLNTEHPAVRTYLIEWSLWLARETGVDGFRLDTARHLPSEFVREWSTALKREFQDFWILGEVFVDDYREQRPYLDAGVDAITDFFTYRNVARALGPGGDLSWLRLPPPVAESFLGERAHARATFIDNHDVPRFIGPSDPDEATRARLTQALTYLFGAPGTPVLYYGTEVGLPGGPDPDNRRLMPWVAERNALQDFVARLAALRQERPALRRGSWVRLAAEREFFAFARQDAAGDLVVVALNGSDASIEREVGLEELQLAAGLEPHSLLDSARGTARLAERTLAISLPPRGAQLLWLGPRLSIAPAADLHSVVIAAAVALVLLAIAGLGALWRRRISGRA
jgi:alpha-amylase